MDATPTRLPAAALELERHLNRRRSAIGVLLSIDAEERWGHPDSARAAALQADGLAMSAQVRDAEAELRRAVPALRATDPAALDAWITAQEALLDAYLAELDQAPDPTRVRTERFVATEERAGWAKVRAGELAFVDQNGFYVHRPRALYEALFGMAP